MKIKINEDVYKKISKKIDILKIIDSIYYDQDTDLLEKTIKEFENFVFNPNQKILIFYQDTGFYQDLVSGTSVFLHNLYVLLKKYSIPSEFLIFFTNHYGLKKEIDNLNSKMNYSIKNIIETSLWYDFPTEKQIKKISQYSLEFENRFLYTCLNNVQRIHRNYTLCQLKENNLLDKGIVSYRFK